LQLLPPITYAREYFMDNIATGVAAELRIMSELVIRGFNPAKSYMDKGVDLILENGKKIQIKSANPQRSQQGRLNRCTFSLGRGNNKKKDGYKFVDYYIFWAIGSKDFWVISAHVLKNKSCFTIPKRVSSKYYIYKNNWEQLK